MQLELLERPYLSAQELADVARDIGIVAISPHTIFDIILIIDISGARAKVVMSHLGKVEMS